MQLKAKDISQKIYKEEILKKISFKANTGEIIGIIGLNGAGKSTLLRILAGITEPTEGNIEIDNKILTLNNFKLRRKISYLSEEAPIYPEMRVQEYLSFQASLKKIPFKTKRKEIKEVLSFCHLNSIRKLKINTLSKGFKQRTALANALLGKPKILILDEPTNGLDPHHSKIIQEIISHSKKENITFITSHFLEEIEFICDKILIIHNGKLREYGKKTEIFSKIQHANIIFLQIKGEKEKIEKALLKIEGIKKISIQKEMENEWNRYQIIAEKEKKMMDKIYHLILTEKWQIREMLTHKPSFQELFKESIFTYE